jgi:hypothetical protein
VPKGAIAECALNRLGEGGERVRPALTLPKRDHLGTFEASVGFFAVVKAELPPDLEPGLKMSAAAIEKMQSAKDALPALLPIGLGPRGGEFDKMFMDTFQFIVLRGQNPRTVN